MKYLRALKSWPWYYWLVALLVPGGLVVVALRSRARSTPPSPINLNPNSAEARAKSATDSLIGNAKDLADSLRSGLANDPLAQNLLGINPGLISAGDPAKVAETSAERDSLLQHIIDIQWRIGYANQQYGIDHFGGQNPEQFAAYIASLEADIAQTQTKLAVIG